MIKRFFTVVLVALAIVSGPSFAQGKRVAAEVAALPDIATGALVRFKEFYFDPEDSTGQNVIINCLVRFNSEVAPGTDDLPVSVALTASESQILAAVRQAVKALCIQQQCKGNSVDTLTNAQILVDAVPK